MLNKKYRDSLEKMQGRRVRLRETAGALLQINTTKGYGDIWTIGLRLDGADQMGGEGKWPAWPATSSARRKWPMNLG